MSEIKDFKLNNKVIVEIFKEKYPTLFENIDSPFEEIKSKSIHEAKSLALTNKYNDDFARCIVKKIEELKDKYSIMFPDEVVKIYNMCSIMSCGCKCRHVVIGNKQSGCGCCVRHTRPRKVYCSFDSFKNYLNI